MLASDEIYRGCEQWWYKCWATDGTAKSGTYVESATINTAAEYT